MDIPLKATSCLRSAFREGCGQGHPLNLDFLRVRDEVTRTSTIADIEVKEGRSGLLCFVAVDHVYSSPRGVAIRERQDIVYRGLNFLARSNRITRSRSVRPDS